MDINGLIYGSEDGLLSKQQDQHPCNYYTSIKLFYKLCDTWWPLSQAQLETVTVQHLPLVLKFVLNLTKLGLPRLFIFFAKL